LLLNDYMTVQDILNVSIDPSGKLKIDLEQLRKYIKEFAKAQWSEGWREGYQEGIETADWS
jgi:hypothetical protein